MKEKFWFTRASVLIVCLAIHVAAFSNRTSDRFKIQTVSLKQVTNTPNNDILSGNKEILLNEGFENDFPPAGWTLIDADGDNNNWIPFTGMPVHSGNQSVTSISYFAGIGSFSPNNYLVSPPVTIPGNGVTYRLKYWVCTHVPTLSGEHYKVALSTTGNTEASFNVTLFEETMPAQNPGYHLRTIDLTGYAGQTIYLAWVHYNCSNVSSLNLDDITISSVPVLPVPELSSYAVNFGSVSVGHESIRKNYRIYNSGTGNLTISSVTSTNPEFSTTIVPAGVTILPGMFYTFDIKYNPTNEGNDNGTITIGTNNGDVALNVSGTGFQLPANMIEIGNDTITNIHTPFEFSHKHSYTQSLYLQSELNLFNKKISELWWHLIVSTPHMNSSAFVSDIKIYMGHTSSTSLTDWIPLNELQLIYSDTLFTGCSPNDYWLQIAFNTPFIYNNTDNLVIAVEATMRSNCLYNQFFKGNQPDGSTNVSIIKYSNSETENQQAPGILSTYRPNLRLGFEAIPSAGSISVSPASLNFGVVETGKSKTMYVTLLNTGNSNVTVTGITGIGAPFSSFVPVFTLAPGAQSSPTAITFTPTTSGVYNLDISYTSNAGQGNSTLTLLGESFAAGTLFESFEGNIFPPVGWTSISATWNSSASYPNSYHGWQYAQHDGSSGMLITPKLNIVQGDKIEFYVKGYGSMNIKYSSDMNTWTTIQTITVTSEYTLKQVLLNAAVGQKYIAFDCSDYKCLDYIKGPALYNPALPPQSAANPYPANAAPNINTAVNLTWSPVLFATGYKIKIGTSNPPTNLVDIGNYNTYTVSGLAYNTVYYWQVVPYNANGDCTNAPVWSFTTIHDPIIAAYPYIQDFEANNGMIPPAGWSVSGNKQWIRGSHTEDGLYCAKVNAYPAGMAILTSPYINLPDSMRISFWYKNNNIQSVSGKRAEVTKNAYDNTSLEISNNHGVTWTNLVTLPDIITKNYKKISVNLNSYSGDSILLRWKDYSDGSYLARGIGIDHIVIDAMPLTPHAELNLNSFGFGEVGIGYYASSGNIFTLTNTGPDTLRIISVTSLNGLEFTTNLNPTAVGLTTNQTVSFGFGYLPVDENTDAIAFEIATNGGTVIINLTGQGIVIPPFIAEDFEGDIFPPDGWTMFDQDGDTFNWFAYEYDPQGGTYCAASASYINGLGALTPDNYLITPKFEVTAEHNIFTWWVAAQDADYPADHYGVYISTTTNTPEAFTEMLFSETLVDNVWASRKVDLRDYMGQEVFIAFRHYDCTDMFVMKIDDVSLSAFVNYPPVFITIPPQTSTMVGDEYFYQAKAIDENNDVVTYGFITSPDWLTIEPGTNETINISGIPPEAIDYPVEIFATDGTDTTYQSWIIYAIIDQVAGTGDCSFRIFPNPAKDEVFISAPVIMLSIKVFNATGNVILNQRVNSQSGKININHLPNGIYLFNITTIHGKIFNKRIVIRH